MAKTNYGFNGLNTNLNPQLTNSDNTLNNISHKDSYIAIRVLDIVLDNKHPKFNEVGGWTGLGAIYFTPVTSPSTIPGVAYPNFTYVKSYPLINEIVYMISLPGDNLNKDKSKVKNYYVGNVNVWNHPHHNAFPSNPGLAPVSQRKTLPLLELGSPKVVSSDPREVFLGNTFKERGDIHPLRPFEGDIIYEGRWGNSIRFGSTVKGTPNDWSDDSTSQDGDPIIVIRNGQSTTVTDPDDPSKNITEEGSIPIVENINADKSSIYLSSTQKINLNTSTTSYVSYEGSGYTPPTIASQFAGDQIILSSGRLVFNSKNDHIILSSAKSINLGSLESVNIDAKKFITQADKIFLGPEYLAKEPLLLGDSTVEVLRVLINELKDLSNVLKTLTSSPAVPGNPVTFPNLVGPSVKLSTQLEFLSKKLNTLTSKRNFTV